MIARTPFELDGMHIHLRGGRFWFMWFYNYPLTNIWNKMLQNGTSPYVTIQKNFDDLFMSAWWARDSENEIDQRGSPLSWKLVAKCLHSEDYIIPGIKMLCVRLNKWDRIIKRVCSGEKLDTFYVGNIISWDLLSKTQYTYHFLCKAFLISIC